MAAFKVWLETFFETSRVDPSPRPTMKSPE
jgi:hypothetical protein